MLTQWRLIPPWAPTKGMDRLIGAGFSHHLV
jgi:hypothetical protein